MEPFEELHTKLRGGLFLSSLHIHGDGAFCGSRSAGCRMVQLGLRLAEVPGAGVAQGEYRRSVLPYHWTESTAHLAEECRAAKSQGQVSTCLNLASPGMETALAAGLSFLEAGGDLVELNVHGSYFRYLELARLRAMVLPEHRPELVRWVEGLVGGGIPLIVKFNGQHDREAVLGSAGRMEGLGLFGVHINVRGGQAQRPDFEFVRRVREQYSGFLLASGHVRSAEDANELFRSGIDMVGIGEPAIEDPGYIARLAGKLIAEAA